MLCWRQNLQIRLPIIENILIDVMDMSALWSVQKKTRNFNTSRTDTPFNAQSPRTRFDPIQIFIIDEHVTIRAAIIAKNWITHLNLL